MTLSLLPSFLLFGHTWILLATAALASFGLAYLFYPALVAARSAEARHGAAELLNMDAAKEDDNIQQQRQPLLSIVVPAYNEELRLTIMLQEAYEYLSSKQPCRALQLLQKAAHDNDCNTTASTATIVEWILVNDGSTDQTCQVYRDWVQQLPTTTTKGKQQQQQQQRHVFKLVSLNPNAGKGAAVQTGMLACQGQFSLMVDADGATQFGSGLEALCETLEETGAAFLLGSRAHLRDETYDAAGSSTGGGAANSQVQRSAIRRLLQTAFHYFVVQLIGGGDIRDTQCGFKLFRQETAAQLFENLRLQRWAFDTEIVYLAAATGTKMVEVPVVWTEVDGSKLDTGGPIGLALVAVGMLRDMMCVRACYTIGIWRIPQQQKQQSTKSKSS
jgi:dolichyl-phosphate beta-glucosyltransferase